MNATIHRSAEDANAAAADLLARWLVEPRVRNVMLAAGGTPLELYRRIGARGLPLAHLNVFVLDEYVGVPLDEPRNCANVLRRAAADPWGVPPERYFTVSSREEDAPASIAAHEQRIRDAGGLDVIILGLGQNGHLGFNEPGSAEDSAGRVLDLDAISVAANQRWFGGDHAPARGVTTGLKTILASQRVLLVAYGAAKREAVTGMLHGPRDPRCPASLLQGHAQVEVFLDEAAAKQEAAA